MEAKELIAVSPQMQEVKRLANLVKGIKVNTIVSGPAGSGKSYLARFILPNAVIVSGLNLDETNRALKAFEEVIIEDFDKILNYDLLSIKDQKIVATSSKKLKEGVVDRFFGIKIDLLPLCDRSADVEQLAQLFLQEAKSVFKTEDGVELSDIALDTSENCHSLRRSVYKSVLLADLDETSLLSIMENYFYRHIEADENYKVFLDLYDNAIITANHKKYKSQLMMSFHMGINRNTLRKKILQLNKKFDDDE